MKDFHDRVAVVTGGARGIGAAIARALAAEGATVVLGDIDVEAATRTAAEVRGTGATSLALHCDVGRLESMQSLADRAWGEFGRVDLVVNNAGVMHSRSPLLDLNAADARWVLETNVLGVWHGCSVFGTGMVTQGTPAHIVNVSSEHSLGVPLTGSGMYTASKHAILGLSDVLRRELPEFIGLSVVCPGGVMTELTDSARHRPERFGGPSNVEHGRITAGMTPDEVAQRTLQGIRDESFYIVTHSPAVELASERWEEIDAAFAAQAPRFEGDLMYDTRELVRRRMEQQSTPS